MYYADIYRRTVQRAAELIGDNRMLARYLNVPPAELVAWTDGRDLPPLPILLRCVDLILQKRRNEPTAAP